MAGNVVRHERYISVDLEYLSKNPDNPNLKGSNKAWWATVYDDGLFLAQYGKVTNSHTEPPGRSEKQCGSVDAANRYMDTKIREKMTPEINKKTGMKTQYTRVEVVETKDMIGGPSVSSKADLERLAREQIGQGDPIVSELVSRLARENVHNILSVTSAAGMTYDDTSGLFSTPMGVVTQGTIDSARNLLSDLVPYVQDRRFTDASCIDLIQNYLRYIPMDLGHKRVELSSIFPDVASITKQGDILESLEASLKMVADRAAADDGQTVRVEPPKMFDIKMAMMADADIPGFRKLYRDTMKSQHGLTHLDVRRVFSVDIRTMREAYEGKGRPIGKEKRLWHGTRTANLLSILRAGLTIPPKNCYGYSGRAYGDGVYFAPNSSKSLQYSHGSGDMCYMFLADVAMGKHYIPTRYGEYRPDDCQSIWAQGGKSGVVNDEIIVPNIYQCNLVYLLEFSRGGK